MNGLQPRRTASPTRLSSFRGDGSSPAQCRSCAMALLVTRPMLVALPGTHRPAVARAGRGCREDAFRRHGELGRNPARIIPAWRDFVDEQRPTAGRSAASASRSGPAARPTSWSSASATRPSSTSPSTTARPGAFCARTTPGRCPGCDPVRHGAAIPRCSEDGVGGSSTSYVARRPPSASGRCVPPPPGEARRLAVTRHNLSEMRKLVTSCAASAGLSRRADNGPRPGRHARWPRTASFTAGAAAHWPCGTSPTRSSARLATAAASPILWSAASGRPRQAAGPRHVARQPALRSGPDPHAPGGSVVRFRLASRA